MRNTILIVDYNRQSLDRVIPGVRGDKLKALFADCGWNVLECKYGAQLQAAFTQPGGEALRLCIDDMSNEAYQSLIRSDAKDTRHIGRQKTAPALRVALQMCPMSNWPGCWRTWADTIWRVDSHFEHRGGATGAAAGDLCLHHQRLWLADCG